jgi:hypothetical protein
MQEMGGAALTKAVSSPKEKAFEPMNGFELMVCPSAAASMAAFTSKGEASNLEPADGNCGVLGGAGVVPGTAVLNPEGGAEFRIVGEASKKDIVSRVEWLLSDRSRKKPKELQGNL